MKDGIIQKKSTILDENGNLRLLRCTPKPILEDLIRFQRRCVYTCPMVLSLDQRMKNQRDLVTRLLKERYNIDVDEFEERSLSEIDDIELKLLWHILKDNDYIDSLR